MKYTNYTNLRETVKPDSIAIGDLIKLIDGRISRIEQDDFVIIIHNGHLCFTTRDEIEESNKILEKNQRMFEQIKIDAFSQTMNQIFGGL